MWPPPGKDVLRHVVAVLRVIIVILTLIRVFVRWE